MSHDLPRSADWNLERIADALEDIARVLSAPGEVDDRPILERMVIALHHLVTRP